MATMMMTEQSADTRASGSRSDADSDRITPYRDLDPEYRAVIDRVRRLTELPEGWDTYGSRGIQPEAVAAAAAVLMSAARSRMPAPVVGPVSGGGLQLEWNLANCAIEVEALPEGGLHYLLCPGDGPEAEGPIDPDRLSDLFARALGRELVAA